MNIFWFFAILNAVPVLLVVASTPLKGLSRWVSPDTLVVLMLFAVFSVRPLFSERFRPSAIAGSGFYGLVPSLDGQVAASIVGSVLLWSIAVGALWKSRRRGVAEHGSGTPLHLVASDGFLPGRAVFITVSSLAVYSAALISFMGVQGFLALSRGRSAEATMDFVPELITVIPLAGSIAGAMLILNAGDKEIKPAGWLAVVFCVAASIFAVSQLGTRMYIIPALLIVLTATLMRKPTRVRLWHVAAGGVALIALAVLPYVRSAGSRIAGESLFDALVRSFEEVGPLGAAKSFFTSYDTQMYDYIAILATEYQNGHLEMGWGRGTFVEFLTRPFPSGMAPFSERSSELKIHLFNYSCFGADCPAPNPVLSVGGLLFFDGWYLAVLVGGLLLGAFVRTLAHRWADSRCLSPANNLVTAVCASYAMIAVRTDTVFAVWWCIYTLAVAAVVVLAMSPKSTGPPGGRFVTKPLLQQSGGH